MADPQNTDEFKDKLIRDFEDLPQETNDMFSCLFSLLDGGFPPVCHICSAREQRAKEKEEESKSETS